MERSKIPVHKWLLAIHLMSSNKNGISAHELHRNLGITYKSAWFLAHRIREAMMDGKPSPMGGEGSAVQADETYYGNTSKRAKGYKKGHSKKAGVVALVEPKTGKVRAKVMKATAKNVREFLVTNVDRKSQLHTDQSSALHEYRQGIRRPQDRQSRLEWARRVCRARTGQTTNNVENFFLQFKRGMRGTFIHLRRRSTCSVT